MKTAAVFLCLLLVVSTSFAARDLKGVQLSKANLISSQGLLSGLSNPLSLINLQNIDNLIKFGTSPSGGLTVTLDTSAVAALKLPVNVADALNNIVTLVSTLLDGITVPLTGAVTDILNPLTSQDLLSVLTPASFLKNVVPLQKLLLPASVANQVTFSTFSKALKEFNSKPINRAKPASEAIQTVYANILSGLSSSPGSLLNGLLGQIPLVDKLLSTLTNLLNSLLGPNGVVGNLLGGLTGTASGAATGLPLTSSISALIMPLSMLLSGVLGNVLPLGDLLQNLGGLGLPVLG